MELWATKPIQLIAQFNEIGSCMNQNSLSTNANDIEYQF